MFQSRYKEIRTILNKKASGVITTDRFTWSQKFEGFKSIRIGSRRLRQKFKTEGKILDKDYYIGLLT
jgi:hypothetical protein